MATLAAFLSTATGVFVAVTALLGMLTALVTALVKLTGTRARLAKLEAANVETVAALKVLKARLVSLATKARTDDAIESVRASLLPEPADAADLEALKQEVAQLRRDYDSNVIRLNGSLERIGGQLEWLATGKVKLQ